MLNIEANDFSNQEKVKTKIKFASRENFFEFWVLGHGRSASIFIYFFTSAEIILNAPTIVNTHFQQLPWQMTKYQSNICYD